MQFHLNARLIEKHVYLDKKNFGPDREVSINFKQLKELVQGTRILEQSTGNKKDLQIRKTY